MTIAVTPDGQTVPLEKWTEPSGPRRYRMVKLGPPHQVEEVTERAAVDAHPDHRNDCPDFDNGLLRSTT